MNYPILYPVGARAFTGKGLGVLSGVIDGSCKVVEQLNTSLEMSMQYPVNGKHFSDIQLYSVIRCKPNPYAEVQPFVVYKISKPLNGIVTIYAEHITYIMDNCICPPYEMYAETASEVGAAISYINDSAIYQNFAVSTQGITGEHKWSFSKVVSVKEARTTITNIFGGEWIFDGTNAKLVNKRGENRGVSVSRGTNMVDFSCEDDATDKYTHIMPYWFGIVTDEITKVQTKEMQLADPVYIPLLSTEQGYFRPYVLDCSSYFANKPTALELSGKAVEFKEANPTMGEYSRNFRVKFVPRCKTVEYSHLVDEDHVEIGDTIVIRENRYGIAESRRCVKTTYDVCADRLTEIELGTVKQSLTTPATVAPKTASSSYGGGYTTKTKVATAVKASAEKKILVRSIETTERNNLIQYLKINYDDGSNTTMQCSYGTDKKLLSIGHVNINRTVQDDTSGG
nr:MAG TPA: tail protein [Caudoviricetes sp.]